MRNDVGRERVDRLSFNPTVASYRYHRFPRWCGLFFCPDTISALLQQHASRTPENEHLEMLLV
jgi:hypothetical protein